MANPFAGKGDWDYGASASRASKDKYNALHVPKHKALSKKLHVSGGGGIHKGYVSEVSGKKGTSGYTKHMKLTEKGYSK